MVFGIAKRGFGMLKKSKKPKISEQLKVFKKASEKSKITQTNKKTMRTLGEMVNKIKESDKRITKLIRDKELKEMGKNLALKKPYSKSKVNKYLTKEYKKQQRKP
jgi:hypothetical protein